MVMLYVMHHAFRRDLAAFVAAAPATPLEDRDAWQDLAARWELFATALHHHHSGEDAGLWPMLMSCADTTGRALLRRWRPNTASSTRSSRPAPPVSPGWPSARTPTPAPALVVRLVTGGGRAWPDTGLTRRPTRDHLDPAGMTDAEWRQVQDDYFKSQPIPPRLIQKMLPWMFDKLPCTVRDQQLAEASLLHRVVYRLFPGSYRRSERRTFQYAA